MAQPTPSPPARSDGKLLAELATGKISTKLSGLQQAVLQLQMGGTFRYG